VAAEDDGEDTGEKTDGDVESESKKDPADGMGVVVAFDEVGSGESDDDAERNGEQANATINGEESAEVDLVIFPVFCSN